MADVHSTLQARVEMSHPTTSGEDLRLDNHIATYSASSSICFSHCTRHCLAGHANAMLLQQLWNACLTWLTCQTK